MVIGLWTKLDPDVNEVSEILVDKLSSFFLESLLDDRRSVENLDFLTDCGFEDVGLLAPEYVARTLYL